MQSPIGLALDETFIYATEASPSGRVLKVGKADGAVSVVAESQDFPHAIAVDADRIYWTCVNTGQNDGRIMSARK